MPVKVLNEIQQISLNTYNSTTSNPNYLYFVRKSDGINSKYNDFLLCVHKWNYYVLMKNIICRKGYNIY